MDEFHPGDVASIRSAFTNAAGEAADPTTITLRIRRLGVEQTIVGVAGGLVRETAGVYRYDYLVPSDGPTAYGVEYRFEGTGDVAAAEEGSFRVRTRWPG